jgi:hypothetical protein
MLAPVTPETHVRCDAVLFNENDSGKTAGDFSCSTYRLNAPITRWNAMLVLCCVLGESVCPVQRKVGKFSSTDCNLRKAIL